MEDLEEFKDDFCRPDESGDIIVLMISIGFGLLFASVLRRAATRTIRVVVTASWSSSPELQSSSDEEEDEAFTFLYLLSNAADNAPAIPAAG